jgi:hypothetical protein
MKKYPVLNESLHHEDVWVSGGIAPRILNLARSGGEWLASHYGHFIPEERAHSIRWIGGWVSPGAGVDAVVKRKSLALPGIERRYPSP